MLRLVFGIAGTGKTTYVLEEISKRAQNGMRSILLVPEQFSSSAEAMAYGRLGDAQGALVETLSFRTMAERILKQCGGLNLRVLSDAGRVVFVRRALEAISGELKAFVRQRRGTSFCNLCAQTLTELKTAGVTPRALREVAHNGQDAKLAEIALIFEAYEAQLAGTALDPEDRLSLAATRAQLGYFSGKSVFVDSFDGFTSPEYTMLEQVLRNSVEVTVCLCCGAPHAGEEALDLFTPVRRTRRVLERLAAKAGVSRAQPVYMELPLRPHRVELANVNLLLASEATLSADEFGAARQTFPASCGPLATPAVYLNEAADEWEELRFAAAQMRRLALEGVPYSSMALVCRDIEMYASAARRQLALFDIPFFLDLGESMEYTAPVAFLRAALAVLAQGISSRTVLALLKTNLCGYSDEELAALENYVYVWEPKAADWRIPFEKNPNGLMAAMDEYSAVQLAMAERVRASVVPVLEGFISAASGANAHNISKRLYLLMDRFGAAGSADIAAAGMDEINRPLRAEQIRRAWDTSMELLDEMAALVGDERLSPLEYDELFLLLVRSAEFGNIPQSLECVVLTGADKMRLAQPEHVFVLGICEGKFPMQVGYSGLLNHQDREALVKAGIDMPGSFENRTLLEEMFFYRALSSPRTGLYLSWPVRQAGAGNTRSVALEPVCAQMNPPALEIPPEYLAATPGAAFDLLGANYRENTPLAASLFAALEGNPLLDMLHLVENSGEYTVHDKGAVRRILGDSISLSATVAEEYYQCRFSYYMNRVLRVRPRRRAKISPVESGSFVHYILEQVMREAGAQFVLWDDEKIEEATRRHAACFVAENLPEDTCRGKWVLEQVMATTARLLIWLRGAAAASEFQVDALELQIGDAPGDISPLTIAMENGGSVRVLGAVDRVDVLRRGGKTYLSIIDYKTGDKTLSIDAINRGRNMQMMIYMDTLCKNAAQRYPNPVPAGVLYVKSDPMPLSGGRDGGVKPACRADGFVVNDPEILRVMDNSPNTEFIPVSFNRDGSPSRSRSGLIEAETLGATFAQVETLLADMVRGVYAGDFFARPTVDSGVRPCRFCAYRAACRHEDGVNEVDIKTMDVKRADFEPGAGGEAQL